MRIIKIYYTSNFAKKASKLSKSFLKEINQREKLFRKNPFNPRLKTHKLSGRLKGYFSFSITFHHRILFKFIAENEVLFYDIGGHEVYK